jgi:hypothetical protein
MKRIIAIAMITTMAVFAAACAGSTTSNTNNSITNKNNANVGNSANSNSTSRRENEHEMMNGEHGGMANRQMEKGMGMRPGMNHNANATPGPDRDQK